MTGVIESTTGGFKFPDGTSQTTAATGGGGAVIHGPALTGNGTGGSPLNVATPLDLTGSSPGGIVNGRNTSNGYGTYGSAATGFGLYGEIPSTSGTGVYGKGLDYGVAGLSTAGTPGFSAGVYGEGEGPQGTGVLAAALFSVSLESHAARTVTAFMARRSSEAAARASMAWVLLTVYRGPAECVECLATEIQAFMATRRLLVERES